MVINQATQKGGEISICNLASRKIGNRSEQKELEIMGSYT
jgi:hypothetical protein